MKRGASRLLVAGFVALACAGCAALTGGAKKDSVEAAREEHAADVAHANEDAGETALPSLDLGDPPRESALQRFGDGMSETFALLAAAALVTGAVHLFQHRQALLALITGALALLFAAAAFLKSWM